jgi:hypothetical protein
LTIGEDHPARCPDSDPKLLILLGKMQKPATGGRVGPKLFDEGLGCRAGPGESQEPRLDPKAVPHA